MKKYKRKMDMSIVRLYFLINISNSSRLSLHISSYHLIRFQCCRTNNLQPNFTFISRLTVTYPQLIFFTFSGPLFQDFWFVIRGRFVWRWTPMFAREQLVKKPYIRKLKVILQGVIIDRVLLPCWVCVTSDGWRSGWAMALVWPDS